MCVFRLCNCLASCLFVFSCLAAIFLSGNLSVCLSVFVLPCPIFLPSHLSLWLPCTSFFCLSVWLLIPISHRKKRYRVSSPPPGVRSNNINWAPPDVTRSWRGRGATATWTTLWGSLSFLFFFISSSLYISFFLPYFILSLFSPFSISVCSLGFKSSIIYFFSLVLHCLTARVEARPNMELSNLLLQLSTFIFVCGRC